MTKKRQEHAAWVSCDMCHLFGVQVPRVTCQREAHGVPRKALMDSMVMSGHRQWSSGCRQLLAPLSADPTHQWPGCTQALMCKLDSRASSSTWKHCQGVEERDPARTPDSSMRTAVLLPLVTATPLPPTMPTTSWLLCKVPLIPQQLSNPLCCKGGGITPPWWWRPKWRPLARSGKTGRGSGGKSGSCCPRKTPTRCLKLWCDPRVGTPSVLFVLSLLHLSNAVLLFTCAAAAFRTPFHPRTTMSHSVQILRHCLYAHKNTSKSFLNFLGTSPALFSSS